MKLLRLAAGIAVSIGILWILDQIPWRLDAAQLNSVQMIVALGASAALSLGVATFCGAIVARVNFLVPSALLACCLWLLALRYVVVVMPELSPLRSGSQMAATAAGFALAIGGAIVGAIIGKRFCAEKKGTASTAD